MKLLLITSLALSVIACGSVVQSECDDTAKTTAQLQIAVPAKHALAQLLMRGDCNDFACAQQANGGCVLWEGTISTSGSTSCRIALVNGTQIIDTADVNGVDACVTGQKRITLGD